MSIVAISQTLGSQGDDIGRELARELGCEFADQEIIVRAAERYGEDIGKLQRFTEERPALRERWGGLRERYRAYVEAVIWELAARDRVVLSGRGAAFLLRAVPHVLRVRITAPEALRIERVQARQGLAPAAAAQAVRQNDRERAARVRFLYQMDWEDPLVYDLVLNTEALAVPDGVRLLQAVLAAPRFRPTEEARRAVRDLGAAAGVRAALLADARTRGLWLEPPECRDGRLVLRGTADRTDRRQAAEEVARSVPGVRTVVNEIVVAADGTLGSTFPR